MHNASGHVLPLLVIGLLFLFALAVLAGLAWLAVRAFKSTGAGGNPAGGVAAGLGGCALAGALGCLGLCTVVAFLVAVVLFLSAHVVDRASDFIPSRVEIRSTQPVAPDAPGRPGLPTAPGAEHQVRLVFTIEGDFRDLPRFEDLIHEISDGEVQIVERTDIDTPHGRRQRIVFSVPIDRHDLRDLEREIRERLPRFRIDQGVVIEFEGSEQDF